MLWMPARCFWEKPHARKMGLMPPPECASELILGSADAKGILESILAAPKNKTVAEAA